MLDQYLQLFWNLVEQYLGVNQRGLISTVQSGLASIYTGEQYHYLWGYHSGSISMVHCGFRSIVLRTIP